MPSTFTTQFLLANNDCFPQQNSRGILDTLNNLTPEEERLLTITSFKKPVHLLFFSLLVGAFGVDRMLLGQVFLGILKLVSLFFIIGIFWALYDLTQIQKLTREYNLRRFYSIKNPRLG